MKIARKAPKPKTTLNSEDFILFYDLVVDRLQKYYLSRGIKINNDSVWRYQNVEGKPFAISFLCEALGLDLYSSEIINNFCDSNRNFINLNYMYSLKNGLKNGALSVVIFKGRADLYARFINFMNLQDFIKNSHTVQSVEEQVIHVVSTFYDSIATGIRFEKAWELLSESFQARVWGSDFSRFKNGYYFFRALKRRHIFLVTKLDESTVECMIYYEKELELPYIAEIDNINKASINNIHSIITSVNSLAALVVELGGNGFEGKAFARLLHPAPTEFIWFECGINPENLKKKYPITTQTITRLLKCTCVKHEGKWFIHRLVPCRS